MPSAVVPRDGRQRAVAAEPRSASGLNPSPRSGVVQSAVELAVLRGHGVGPADPARAPLCSFEGDAAHAGAAVGAVPWPRAKTAGSRVRPPAAHDTDDFSVGLDQVASAATAHGRLDYQQEDRRRPAANGRL